MRSKITAAVATAAAAALLLAACGGGGDNASGDDTGGSATAGAALTIAKPDGAITTESNNPWVADASAMRLGYINAILEPLGIVNLIKPSDPVTPWLASDLAWNDDFTELTATARDGVTWSDGEAFTADDIAYTYQMILDHPELNTAALPLKSVAEDGNKVTLTFTDSVFVKQDKVLHRAIVPKHYVETLSDPTTDPMLDLVGTGPYTLTQFTSQSVELKARTDYWGGDLAVPTLYYVSYNDNTALATALANGDADWAQAWIPNRQQAFLDHDPDHNVFWAPSGLAFDGLYVNTTKKPFNDVAFRQAVNMVIDRHKYQQIAREGGVPEITSVTGLPTPAGNSFISDEFQGKDFKVDVAGAKKLLEDAGYTGVGTALVDPSGQPVTFDLTVPQGWSDYVTGISLIADDVKALGVTATLTTPDADTWWANKSNGEFDAILHWTDTGMTPYDIYSNTMDARWLKPIGEAADYNFGRFDSSEATAALDAFANATSDDERSAALADAQRIFVNEVPVMPIASRPFITQFNTRNYVGWPSDDDPYINADPTQPTSVLILTKLKPAS
ncbi:ABC transporter substrate-binding protein [Xylanimonas allomyrinae]|uniref:ABC transporter substrate-binding protein n=1 Tax=Xylanimonas allomyrinae TaxID=2509459 RepID=A0A4V0YE96_9MICO|nr:ABC transporter substrate-binding protein [Xylanimonas allomyrinae]QAY63441.1 ABC transporter substrate-binding protein [Xylanimonas allomyrinae]